MTSRHVLLPAVRINEALVGKLADLDLGIAIAEVDVNNPSEVTPACSGASRAVSALQGVKDVIVGARTVLLEAASRAGVPRFMPSDYSIDFTRFPPGENRNLDLRRDLHRRLDTSSISATTAG